ncbi:kinesin-like protein KIF3A [Onthophagus taurus]|uniref:kinesin-like protein KIF3A n=1 Tax=Onthophagus taurus TaxID=166361 RepID=UPI0039BE0430
MSSDFVRVAIRAAPPRKKNFGNRSNAWIIEGKSIKPLTTTIQDGFPMNFDFAFDSDSTNKQVFDSVVAPMISSTFEGYNSTIFAYGPTLSGKFFTMEEKMQDPGMILRSIEEVFNLATKERKSSNYLIRCAFFMVYNNKIYDLLKYLGKCVQVTNLPSGEITIAARETVITSKKQAFDLFDLGLMNRDYYVENCNLMINHCNIVFRLIIEHEIKHGKDTMTPTAHLNLVTLGGCERVKRPADTPRFVDRDFADNFAQKVGKLQNMPTINIIGNNNVLRQVLEEIKVHVHDLKEVKRNSDVLDTVGLIKQASDLLKDRIKLLKLVITKPAKRNVKRSYNFDNLLSKKYHIDFSTIEVQIVNVLTANRAFEVDNVEKKIKLPFIMIYFYLSTEVGNEFISPNPEHFWEELSVADYVTKINPKFELEMLSTDDDSDVDATPEVTDISQDYSSLKKSFKAKIQSKKLKIQIGRLLAIYDSAYAEQVSDIENISAQNQSILDQIAEMEEKELTLKNKTADIIMRLELTKTELENRNKPIPGDIRNQYELLLVDIRNKDAEFFALQQNKQNLEEKIQEIRELINKYTSPTETQEKLAASESNVNLLQSEASTLRQKIVDQDFIIEDMDVKHKRREEELLKRISEKTGVEERVYSAFLHSDKQVQVAIEQGDSKAKLVSSVCVGNEKVFVDVGLQTEKSLSAEISLQTTECIVIPRLLGLDESAEIKSTATPSFTSVLSIPSMPSIPSTSSGGEMTFETVSAEEECLSDLRRVKSVMEHNKTLLKKVFELEVLFNRNLCNYIERNPELNKITRIKEQELNDIKTELQVVESRLKDLNDEFHKLKDQSCTDLFEGGTKKTPSPKTTEDCPVCGELAQIIKRVSQELEFLDNSGAVEKFRSTLEFRQKELDVLHTSNRRLNTRYLKLMEDYESVLKMVHLQPEDPEFWKTEPRCSIS